MGNEDERKNSPKGWHTLSVPAFCSGKKTASELIFTGKPALTSIILLTDGTNDATLTVYDNTEASGKIVREFKIKGAENFGGMVIKNPIFILNGIYAELSGIGASYFVDYIEETFFYNY